MYNALLFVEDLKLFHNEHDVPYLVDKYIDKYSISNELSNDHKKNMVFYRR